jgi:hypothetical protein
VTRGIALSTAALVLRSVGIASAVVVLSACSMGGISGAPSPQAQQLQTAAATPDQLVSPALPAIATECPPIKVRPGAEALYFYGKGQVGNPRDLQYQAVIDQQSRNCVVSNGLITVKMGVVGRFMLGPDGNQTSVELPLRFAVERDEAPLFSEKYNIPVQLAGGTQATDFVKVVENVQIPYVSGDNITIWVGFDSAKS